MTICKNLSYETMARHAKIIKKQILGSTFT